MDTRRAFLKKSLLLSGAYGLSSMLTDSIQKAFAISPVPGSSYLDAEHIVILMQENRSFDHCFGSLKGVRGFNDPRAIQLPNQLPVWLQTNSANTTYAPFRLNIRDTRSTWMGDLPHSRSSQVDALNEGKYDQWLNAKKSRNQQYAGMPLTLGHYTRDDLPFHYAMADAFTICDQYFCSCVTSTTPNRSYFWTGNIISEEAGRRKFNIRNTDYQPGKHTWNTFPELLQANQVSWKMYQNETGIGGGFSDQERSWLSNFGCNVLEYFTNYGVKFSHRYVDGISSRRKKLDEEIRELMRKEQESGLSDAAQTKIRKDILAKQEVLTIAEQEWVDWTKEKFDQLPADRQQLFQRAFTVNDKDPDYRSVTTVSYSDRGTSRQSTIPKGDLFYQFRKDVNEDKLPAVSWLVSPQNFSDHPSAPWYGAWYVSEMLDILTANPDVWRKTIFIVTYDENDGYFDHIPPFLPPDAARPETGKCSAGIDTEVEWIRREHEILQGVGAKEAREGPVGLGYRVPMIIASPWTRGGNVCSQLFDHTSTIQFLETFIRDKWGKPVRCDNISEWRRAVSGNLTAAFMPYAEKKDSLPFLSRTPFMEAIYNAQFKQPPAGYKSLSADDIAEIKQDPYSHPMMPRQEEGIRPSSALPYELYADGTLAEDGKTFDIAFMAGNKVFGSKSAGSPFTVYAAGKYLVPGQKTVFDNGRIWSFAVKAGDLLTESWALENFEQGGYHLKTCGPNGFLRSYRGSSNDPRIKISCHYDVSASSPGGGIRFQIQSAGQSHTIEILDNSYRAAPVAIKLSKKRDSAEGEIASFGLEKSFGWYDFSIRVRGSEDFERRFAGRVETGKAGFSDPFMGRVI